MAKQNPGKKFEQDVLNSVPKDVYKHRIKDSTMRFKGDNNVCDMFLFKEDTLYKIVERSFFIWLYPNHKLPISQVKEILKPYLEDDKKAEWLGEKLGEYLQKCIEIRQEDVKEQKNLKAQINK